MKKQVILGITSAVLVAGSAFADTTTTSFGPLNAATFGGTGIDNQNVLQTVFTDSSNGATTTLGLAATGRYYNPPVGVAGPGSYTAGTGANYGNPAASGPSAYPGATWNFSWYVNSSVNLGDYSFKLLYSLTPGGPVGTINLNLFNDGSSTPITLGNTIQNSENLLFTSTLALGTTSAGVTAPAGTFDPNTLGQYDFTLEMDSADGRTTLASETIHVNVVPEVGSTGILFCLALGGLGAYSRMRRQSVA